MATKGLLLCLPAVMLATFTGCSEPAGDISPHPTGWVELHQARVRATNYDFTSCGQCHGADLSGAEIADGCSGETCHKHDTGWYAGHQLRMRTSNYDFEACKGCHGHDLAGTDVADGCSRESCHTAVESVYSCDNCHGNLMTEPFKNLAGETSTDILTVGVHTSHYTAAHNLTSNVTCASCHIVPDSVWAEGHIDTSAYAEVNFGPLGDVAAVGTYNSWNRNTGECSNIYCHGAWAYERADSTGKFITGNNITMTWTKPVEGILCGTCHNLPPMGHIDISANSPFCSTCHPATVAPGDNSTIIGLDRHISGDEN